MVESLLHKKKKLSIDEIIKDMKNKGISFKYISEEEVKKYLSIHTYYFKLKSYAKNFQKYDFAHGNKYISLEFSYLQDLARLDMKFRELVFKLTSDLEHLLKVQLLNHSQKNDLDDGYKIVYDFLEKNQETKAKFEKHSKNGYDAKLIQHNIADFPIWAFLESITFGDLTYFYSFYVQAFPIGNNASKYLWSARILRNAAAHNSCVLNRLAEIFEDKKINNSLMNILKKNYMFADTKRIKKHLKNPVVQDFLDVLILYKRLDKNSIFLKRRLPEIDSFFKRCWKNASYYKKNITLVSAYKFVFDFYQEYKESL